MEMDGCFAIELINEIPRKCRKEQTTVKEMPEDFEFNQDQSFDSNEEYRSPGWARLRKKLTK